MHKVGEIMKRMIYCSTGTTVSRRNGYNFHLVTQLFPQLQQQGIIDGAEFMMIPAYYPQMKAVADEWLGEGLTFPVIHCEKEVGTLLSDAAAAKAAGESAAADVLLRQALDDFKKNCEMGAMAGSGRMVFHLWGGLNSDGHVEFNISVLPQLMEIIRPYGIQLLIENVPCTTKDPLSNWKSMSMHLDRCGLIFDTRFGFFHRQIENIWQAEDIYPRIEHIHIGDIRGAEKDFSTLRPIYHPGEGMVDFQSVVRRLNEVGYAGTVTLESPVATDGGADGDKLKASLLYTRNLFAE